MRISRISTIACGLALATSIGLGSGLVAAQGTSSTPVAIISGTCDVPGSVVYQLQDARAFNGNQGGSTEALAVLESDTELDDVGLNSLLSDPHAIIVGDPANPVACGNIGGLVDDGDLYIGIAPLDTPDAFGIAYLDGDDDDDDDDLDIEVLVTVP